MAEFVLGKRSRDNLSGVEPRLARTVERAIKLTKADFMVFEGLRTIERQRIYVARGVSKTMNSKHLRQADGFGHAVDLVPWIDSGPRWEWPPIYEIAWAMAQSAQIEGVEIVWGGVWDKRMSLYAEGFDAVKNEVGAYARRHPGPDFLDGPHFQLA